MDLELVLIKLVNMSLNTVFLYPHSRYIEPTGGAGACFNQIGGHASGKLGNCIYLSISNYGSDTPVTRPETDKAGLSSRDRKRGGGI